MMAKKVESMKNEYLAYRAVRHDGDSFYRSVMYAYLERVILAGAVPSLAKLYKTSPALAK